MAGRREVHERHVLPIGSESVRQRLDVEAGEGTSAQGNVSVHPREHRESTRGAIEAPPNVVETPRRHHGGLRGIRRRLEGMRQLELDKYMLELDRTEAQHRGRGQEWDSDDDISPDEDSGDEYVPPGARGRATGERERASDLDFSGFSAFEEEEEMVGGEESESEGDGVVPVRGEGGRARA